MTQHTINVVLTLLIMIAGAIGFACWRHSAGAGVFVLAAAILATRQLNR
jgi:hypothetical protein